MAEPLKPLKRGDEVYVSSLDTYGRVLHVVPGEEPEEEKAYQVQITRFFRRSDLDFYDQTLEAAKREAILQKKVAQSETAQRKWRELVAQDGSVNSPEAARLGLDVLKAASEVAREFGRYATDSEGTS